MRLSSRYGLIRHFDALYCALLWVKHIGDLSDLSTSLLNILNYKSVVVGCGTAGKRHIKSLTALKVTQGCFYLGLLSLPARW